VATTNRYKTLDPKRGCLRWPSVVLIAVLIYLLEEGLS
jgi:hypothetical protein